MASEEFVNVPVPRSLVTEVMGFIAARSGPQAAIDPVASPGEEADVEWSVEDLHRLRATEVKTTRTVSALLDVLCQDPGAWFTTSDLEASTGIDRREIKGGLSALTRHVRKHYGRSNWPMDYAWGGSIPGAPLEGHYRVTVTTAERWSASA